MHPAKIGFESCDLDVLNKIVNRETQTSKASVTSDSKSSQTPTKYPISKTPSRTPSLNTPSSRTPTPSKLPNLRAPSGSPSSHDPPSSTPPTNSPTPPGNDIENKDSLTVFEFCQILQNPESPKSFTLIKESISQEIHKHPAKQASEEGVANRYKYCREVIEPYLKPHPPGCPQSQETLLKDVLESVQKDFPDYRPCIETYLSGPTIGSNQSSLSKVDAVTSYDSKPSKAKMDHCEQKTNPATTVEQRPGCFTKEADTPSGLPDPGCDLKKSNRTSRPPCKPKKKSVEKICEPTCEAECAAKKVPPKKPRADECPPPIDYCKKRSEESIGKKKKTSAEFFGINQPIPPERKSSASRERKHEQSMKQELSPAESACEKLSQIKTTMEDFISKVYTTTQETVTLIKTESARQFDLFNKSSCEQPEKDDDSERSRYGMMGEVDSRTKDTANCEGRSPGAMLGNLVGKVDSAVSKLGDKMDVKNLPEAMKPKSFNDTSSKYDIPTPPKEIANIIVQTSITSHTMPVPQSSSVFASIKTKICSLFFDEEKKNGSDSSSSSNHSRNPGKDDDSDLIDRLIE